MNKLLYIDSFRHFNKVIQGISLSDMILMIFNLLNGFMNNIEQKIFFQNWICQDYKLNGNYRVVDYTHHIRPLNVVCQKCSIKAREGAINSWDSQLYETRLHSNSYDYTAWFLYRVITLIICFFVFFYLLRQCEYKCLSTWCSFVKIFLFYVYLGRYFIFMYLCIWLCIYVELKKQALKRHTYKIVLRSFIGTEAGNYVYIPL